MTEFDFKAACAGLSENDLADLRAAVGFSDARLANALYAIATEPDQVRQMTKACELFKRHGPKAVQLVACARDAPRRRG